MFKISSLTTCFVVFGLISLILYQYIYTLPFKTQSKLTLFLQPLPIYNKKRPLEYISVNLPTKDILETLDTAFASISSNKARFYKQLQETRRVQPEFHVTLIHRASSKQHPELWQRYSELHTQAEGVDNTLGECKVILERVCIST